MNLEKKKQIWLFSTISMLLFSTALLLSTSCGHEKRHGFDGGESKGVEVSKDGHNCIQKIAPQEDKIYTISFKRDEFFQSMDIEPRDKFKSIIWEAGGKTPYTVSVSSEAEIIYFDADMVLIEYPSGYFITVILDRNVYTGEAQQKISLTAEQMIKKYRNEFKGKIPEADIFKSLQEARGDIISRLGFPDLKKPVFE